MTKVKDCFYSRLEIDFFRSTLMSGILLSYIYIIKIGIEKIEIRRSTLILESAVELSMCYIMLSRSE